MARIDWWCVLYMWQLLKEFPRDLMSLKRAQLICFYMGRPDTSLKFVEQVSSLQRLVYVYMLTKWKYRI